MAEGLIGPDQFQQPFRSLVMDRIKGFRDCFRRHSEGCLRGNGMDIPLSGAVLRILQLMALADGIVAPEEEAMLEKICRRILRSIA